MKVSDDLNLLEHRVRPAEGPAPEGALVLLHGRGANEHDLFPLLDVFDPDRRLIGLTPRAPLHLPPGGFHWYVSAGIPTPDRDTFFRTFELVGRWLAAFEKHSGVPISRTVIGGFSQGTVMTYAMSLGRGRPRPAGIMAFSGFLPEVAGFDLDMGNVKGLPVALGHGTMDSVISVDWGRQARERLEAAGARVKHSETPMGHSIDPAFAAAVANWLNGVIADLPGG